MFSPAEKALIGKDFATLWKSRNSRTLQIMVPFLLALVIPVIFLVAICLVSNSSGSMYSGFSNLVAPDHHFSTKQLVYYIFVDMLTPMLFTLIPAVTAAFGTIFLFVGEREGETMETLLYSALPASNIFRAKVVCIFINSLIISAVSFISIFIINSVGNIILKVPFFFNLEWAIIVLIISPATICLSTFLILLITKNTKRFIDSVAACGYVGAPFVIAFICQFAGIFRISWLSLLIFALIEIAADLIIYFKAFRKVKDETLLCH